MREQSPILRARLQLLHRPAFLAIHQNGRDLFGMLVKTLAAAAKELGPNALAVEADSTDVAATEWAIARAVEKFGKLDIVFANAGIAGTTPVGGTTLAAFEQVLRAPISRPSSSPCRRPFRISMTAPPSSSTAR